MFPEPEAINCFSIIARVLSNSLPIKHCACLDAKAVITRIQISKEF